MKVDLLDRDAVDFGFGLGQSPENPAGQLLLPLVEVAGLDHRQDMVQVPMAVLGFVVDRNLCRAKAVLLDFLRA